MPNFLGNPTKKDLVATMAEQKATIAEQNETIAGNEKLIQILQADKANLQEQIAALMKQVTSLEDTLRTYDDDLEKRIEATKNLVKAIADSMVENARKEEQTNAAIKINEIKEKSRQAMEKAASDLSKLLEAASMRQQQANDLLKLATQEKETTSDIRDEIMRLTKRYEEFLGFEQSIQQKGETQSLADFVKGITKDCLSGLNQPNKAATAKAIYYGNWVGMLYGLTPDDDDKRKTALKPEQKKTIIKNIRPYLLRYKFSGDDKVDSAFHDAYMSAAIKAGYIDLNDMDILEIFDRFFVTPEKGMKGRLEKVVEEFEPKHGEELSQKPSGRKGILARLGLRRKKENVKALSEGQTNEVKEPNSEEVPKNKLPEQTPIEALTSINNPKFIFRILEGFISLYKEEANTNRENQTVYNDYLLVSILSKHLCSLLSDKGLIYGNKQKLISLKDKLSSLPAHQYEGNQLDFSLVIETIDKLLQKIEQKQVETKPQQELQSVPEPEPEPTPESEPEPEPEPEPVPEPAQEPGPDSESELE